MEGAESIAPQGSSIKNQGTQWPEQEAPCAALPGHLEQSTSDLLLCELDSSDESGSDDEASVSPRSGRWSGRGSMAPSLSGNARTSQLVRARQSVVKFPKGKKDRKAAHRPSSLLHGLGPEPPKRRGAAAPTRLEQAQLRSLVKRLGPSPAWATAIGHMTRALQEGALRRAFQKAESRRAQGPSLVSLWAWTPEECSDQFRAVLSGPVTCMAYDSVRAIVWRCQHCGAVSGGRA